MPKRSPHPHVSWRDGRPRFQPDQRLRAEGYTGQDLRQSDGRWFTKGEAVDWSLGFVSSLKTAKKQKKGQPRAAAPKLHLYTLSKLFNDWQISAKFQIPAHAAELQRARAEKSCYSPKTVREYRQKIRLIEAHDPSLAASPVDAISQAHMVGLYDELLAGHGQASARGAMLVLSSALAWGKRRGKFRFANNGGVNPAQDLGMVSGRKRLRIGSKHEIAALITAADAQGWPEMADMIVLGLWTGQRQEDRLQLTDKGFLRGRRIFRQAKTGAIVSLAESPQLEARMRQARERRQAAGIVNPHVILDEQGDGPWQPFPADGDRYRKRFAELRAIAARAAPSLEGDRDRGELVFYESDLRATAVTWMAMGGAQIPEIIAVTGHTLGSATNILKHYLATHPDMADAAIAKMVAFYEGDGEAEFGL